MHVSARLTTALGKAQDGQGETGIPGVFGAPYHTAAQPLRRPQRPRDPEPRDPDLWYQNQREMALGAAGRR